MRLALLPMMLGAVIAAQSGAPAQSPAAGSARAPRAPAPVTHVLIVAGVGGAPEYEQEFYESAMKMAEAARTASGVADSAITVLTERPERDSRRIAGRSTKTEVQRAIARIAKSARSGDVVFVLLIGHGSARDGHSLLNLPGPDMSAAEFARALKPLSTQRVAVVNTASASAEFIPVLSARHRAIITATSSVMERNATHFARHFVDAYSGNVADADKDGRLSLLEAYTYARREVARGYESGNQLQSEHAMLDDDGDGKGTAEPGAHTADGALASRLFLRESAVAANVVAGAGSSDPRVAALLHHKDSLDAKIDALRRRKASMDSTAYERALEALLVDLATTNRTLRQLTGGTP
ncbi:MAG TPA: hypothetical protein VFK04_04220 [Gemmatimonadaceae bacterium]|nr:hypothetical protein [Gemmatimonadaceae bacterium]